MIVLSSHLLNRLKRRKTTRNEWFAEPKFSRIVYMILDKLSQGFLLCYLKQKYLPVVTIIYSSFSSIAKVNVPAMRYERASKFRGVWAATAPTFRRGGFPA